MGHYDTQIEQHNEENEIKRRTLLEIRLCEASKDISTNDLKKLVMAAENWDHVVSVINIIQAMGKK